MLISGRAIRVVMDRIEVRKESVVVGGKLLDQDRRLLVDEKVVLVICTVRVLDYQVWMVRYKTGWLAGLILSGRTE